MILDQKITIYIPGTDKDQKPTPALQIEARDRALYFLASRLGGATADAPAVGAWVSEVHGVVLESIVKVHAFTDKAGLAEHLSSILEFVRTVGAAMGQEAMSVEINGSLRIMFANESIEEAA